MSATRKGGDRLARKLQALARARGGVRAGVLENAANEETHEKIAPYAAANEYGAPGIPARPFMRTTMTRESRKWEQELVKTLLNNRPAEQAHQLVGMRMAEDIQATINSNMAPPNAPATIRAKTRKVDGGAPGETMTPGTLIDTGSMLHSITCEVES